MKDLMIWVDLAKNVFQVHGALLTSEVQFRKKLTRKKFPAFPRQAAHPSPGKHSFPHQWRPFCHLFRRA
jgi:hypothetical protein